MIVILFCFLSYPFFSNAQKPARKTVGLVLSGGGAKGMAHIGIIRALEENGIPIDYIAGTSVGAIVGGLYAAGYSTDEMESIFISSDFNQWISGNVKEDYIYYFKKNETTPEWLKPIVKVDSLGLGFKLPTNIISPTQIDYEFMRIYSGAEAVARSNFDSLFVPFRCAAANLNKQKIHYFDHGNLGTSIRASMTFPFLFKPVIIDSIVYFDGGMYDNFPVKALQKDFNPDVVIGSKVAENFPPPKDGDLVSYLQKMIAQYTDYSLGESRGIILVPDLSPELNIINFKEACEMGYAGYACAMEHMDSIKAMVDGFVSQDEVESRRRRFRAKAPPLLIDSVILVGVSHSQEKYIMDLLGKGNTNILSVDKMKGNYFRLFSDDNIQYIYPSLLFDTCTKKYKLSLNIDINESIMPSIGGYLAVGAPSEAFLEISYRRLRKIALFFKVNGYLGDYYNSIMAYSRLDFPTALPFCATFDYTFNKWNYFNDDLFRSESFPLTHLTQIEQHIKSEIGCPIRKNGKFFLHTSASREDDSYKESSVIYNDDKPDNTVFNSLSLELGIERNTLDKPQYASKGIYSSLIITGLIGKEYFRSGSSISSDYEKEMSHKWLQLYYKFQGYNRITNFYSLGISLECSASWQDNFLNYASTLLHTTAFFPTVQSRQYFMPEYRDNFYAAVGLQNVFKLYQNLQLRVEGYAFFPLNRTFLEYYNISPIEWENYKPEPLFVFSSGLVYHSPIGPISLLFNYHQREDSSKPFSIIFNIGYVFFNKRGYGNNR